MIEECRLAALEMDRDCYGNTVSANVIAHNGVGVDLRDAHGCAVSANTFTIMKTDAVRVGPHSGRITVSANCFSDSYIGGGLKRQAHDREAAGMVIDQAHDVFVTGNGFSGVQPQAVAFGENPSTIRSAVTNNYFVETTVSFSTTEISGNHLSNNVSVSVGAVTTCPRRPSQSTTTAASISMGRGLCYALDRS
jgi:parallel beta-helix repeat protein